MELDLESLNRSVTKLRADIPEDAFTAGILGSQRIGNGVVIDSAGLVLTIGYLMTEATDVWLTDGAGREIAAHPLAYDQVTGFGLVLPLQKLDAPPMSLGSSAELHAGSEVHVLSAKDFAPPQTARVLARREFAGAWEYLLEEAIFTAPAHPHWSGAALIDNRGTLVGLGSLLVREVIGGEEINANMFVPIDLLDPILEDMKKLGRPARNPRPWLGMYTTPMQGSLVVGALTQGGPAHRAGVRLGDVVLEVAGEPVADLADLFRRVWDTGSAGTEVPLTLARGKSTSRIRVTSADREDFLTKPRRH